MWAHAEGAPELLTGQELDTLEPRDLEYRCPSLPILPALPSMLQSAFSLSVSPAAWALFSCLPACHPIIKNAGACEMGAPAAP